MNHTTTKPMKLYVTDQGDRTVGIWDQTWTIECPFNEKDIDTENLEWFRSEIERIYKEFCDGRIECGYEKK